MCSDTKVTLKPEWKTCLTVSKIVECMYSVITKVTLQYSRVAEGQSGLPGRPAWSACQAGHLVWPGRSDRDLTGRQVGIHPLIIINWDSFRENCPTVKMLQVNKNIL